MAVERPTPYVWITWLSKIMSGEQACHWASWFKAHYQGYVKPDADTSLVLWNIEHTKLLAQERARLSSTGATVRVEGQNAFKYRHHAGLILAGRPDIVVIDDTTAAVVDCKTGRRKTSDQIQVLIYMHLLPLCTPNLSVFQMNGRIVYPDGQIDLSADMVDERFVAGLEYFLSVLASTVPAAAAPSQSECRFCDITHIDCPHRWGAVHLGSAAD